VSTVECQREYPRPIRAGLAEQVTESLLKDIYDGTYAPDSQLPPESVLAEQTGVSRLTLREAIKALHQRGFVRVEQGRGTFVNPQSQWLPLDPKTLAHLVSCDPRIALAVTEVRSMVEVGAAELAAGRRTAVQLAHMVEALDMMAEHLGGDVDAFSRADIRFHEAVMRAAGNEFIPSLMTPLDAALLPLRRQTSQDQVMNKRALVMHRRIHEAIRDRSARAARTNMAEHMQETQRYFARLSEGSNGETSD